MSHILVVEDEAIIRSALRRLLERHQYQVSEAGSVADAVNQFDLSTFDLVISDLRLPGDPGTEMIRRAPDTPVLIMTSYASLRSAVDSMKLGAVDYIAKPFSTAELIARIQAVLRRVLPGGAEERIEVQGLEVDTASQRVTANGEAVKLGPTEYRLLNFFVSNPERVYTREQVLDRVWGQNVYVEERTVDVHIRRLRKALTPFGFADYIQTVRGTGYRFSTKV